MTAVPLSGSPSKVLGISGSPRRRGNTEILLEKALEGASSLGVEAEKVAVCELRFEPCRECGGCAATGICVVGDDMQMVYEKIARADGIVIASPLFFGSITAQLKGMIDRFQCAWIAKYALKRPISMSRKKRGAFICAGGSGKKELFDSAKKVIQIFFTTLDIEYARELFCPRVEAKAEILKNGKALAEAYEIGRNIATGILEKPDRQ